MVDVIAVHNGVRVDGKLGEAHQGNSRVAVCPTHWAVATVPRQSRSVYSQMVVPMCQSNCCGRKNRKNAPDACAQTSYGRYCTYSPRHILVYTPIAPGCSASAPRTSYVSHGQNKGYNGGGGATPDIAAVRW